MSRKRKEDSSLNRTERAIEDRILENLIELQKVHTNLAEKFDKLTKEMSHLLALFELAAQNFSKHPALKVNETDKEFLDKIDKLLEQNKTIAKGLTFMEEQIRKKVYHQQPTQSVSDVSDDEQATKQISDLEEYTPSLATTQKPIKPLPRF